ncbi:hypothetical protein NX059_002528 [Plenodomus lindquistii]|nr:hypothetical protein NX059_002528 [Plenodomus lindquistii]
MKFSTVLFAIGMSSLVSAAPPSSKDKPKPPTRPVPFPTGGPPHPPRPTGGFPPHLSISLPPRPSHSLPPRPSHKTVSAHTGKPSVVPKPSRTRSFGVPPRPTRIPVGME